MREIREDKENSKKVEKTSKNVLTKGVRCGIIYESLRESSQGEAEKSRVEKNFKKV